MKKRDVRELANGLYLIYWKDGGSSMAAVGRMNCGDMWLAPTNWVSPSVSVRSWKMVKHVVPVMTKIPSDNAGGNGPSGVAAKVRVD